ncbi:MAG: hypothetical protein LAO19_05595 [Acidobacteriia bacterium]|nr:hypothetical protein [Terriglobia bacterium]
MTIPTPRPALALLVGITALFLAGCHSSKPAPAANGGADPGGKQAAESQSMAEAALGKQAEILEHGDLARNGAEQILAVNRIANAQRAAGKPADAADPASIFIRRAAILEKSGGKWSEVLRCDEHVKNPNGYLAGTPAARVSGWRLEYSLDSGKGLEMKFIPADSDADGAGSGSSESPGKSVVVRWNKSAKRYQSLDQSMERYLTEVPTLETPMSILK